MNYSAHDEFERLHLRPRAGRALIVGSRVYEGRTDRRRAFKDVVGVDMQDGPGVDRVLNLEEEAPSNLGRFEHVECLSVLEHTRAPWRLSENLLRLMEPGATIYLSVPFVHRLHAYPADFWRFTADAVPLLFPPVRWSAVLYAHHSLQQGGKLPGVKSDGYPYHARCDVLAFGELA